MMKLVNADNGMNIFGRGLWIMLFAAPVAAAAVVAHLRVPDRVRIPLPEAILRPIGVALVMLGLVLWLTALVQLLIGFPRGRLVRNGAYSVCRNPIYASVGLFVLPGLSLVCGTWVYFVAAAALCLGVEIFIRREERDLLRVFGEEYRSYTARVRRLIPFARPAASAAAEHGQANPRRSRC